MPGVVVERLLAAWLLLAGSFACAADGAALPPLVDESMSLGRGWQVRGLPKQKPPLTRYSVERVDGRTVLRIEAHASYGNLVHEFSPAVPLPMLRWSWRLERGNARADLQTKDGDDVPARVCASFELPLERVPFVDRQLLRMARSASRQRLPSATLCWVWDHTSPVGALLPNAYSGRVRMIVLRNAQHGLGTWYDEVRDVAADFRAAFGEESLEVPPVSAVIVAGDADNTGERSVAFVADLRAQP
jgi:hypothetical protein